MALEFHDLEREKQWQMMPGIHAIDTLAGWIGKETTTVKIPRCGIIQCKPTTDWGQLAGNLVVWIEAAFRTITQHAQSLRQKHLKKKADSARHSCSRLTFWSGKLGKACGGLRNGRPWNVFRLSEQLLKASEAGFEVLERMESSVRGNDAWRRMVDLQQQVTKLLHEALTQPDTGSGDHVVIPHCGVIQYSFWHTFPRKLFVAMVEERANARIELVLGTSDAQLARPIPTLRKLDFVVLSEPRSKAEALAKKFSDKTLAQAKELLADPEDRFIDLRV